MTNLPIHLSLVCLSIFLQTMNNGMYMESSGRRGLGVDEACSILTK